ncbi:hybrid sensor histidine kinase/response regulator [Scytonema hofmannii PCC 7110]|uniref:histidine kinase n=1 Tax=Scytonema hofmannii PCC 7110 TaxID=128403 RepID=A0A139X8V5_9CYAN|nr:response regulator [Scytonema hofmannii]KYC41063.1 hybrid sensor histidine kinase/response regulator [Scytonema hofmannii PCC 7110]
MMTLSSDTYKTKNIQILIVEDEYILALNLQESLETLGYTVMDTADSGEEAIAKATELRPNLILMDIRLQGEMDGIQAAEQIWNHLQIPIIYLTGHSDKSTVERATLTFPFGYILKPVREQELYVAIQTALNRYEREQFLTSVLRGIGDGVIVVDTQLRVKYMNQIAESLTGWLFDTAKEQMLDEVFQIINEQTQLRVTNPITLALQQETTICLSDPTLLIAKDGTKTPIADSATPIKDNHGAITGAVMVFRDDTQRRLIEERNLAAERAQQLQIQIAELQRLNKLKEEFLTVTSHEMRTPLSNIITAISLLENLLDRQGILQSEATSIERCLSILRYESERELDLVDDLLTIRLLDADIYRYELTSVQLQYWLPHCVESFQNLAQSQQQTLTIEVPRDLPSLMTDLPTLTRIVSELLNNACKYTPCGENITVTARLADNTNTQSSYLQILISNSGVEIPEQERDRIFEPFYQLPQSQTTEPINIFDLSNQTPSSQLKPNSCTGLGLALVKKLVNFLQGSIEVTNTQGWTIFTVQLPLTLSDCLGSRE